MQKRNQSRSALVDDAKLTLDKGAGVTRCPGQSLGGVSLQRLLLHQRQTARTASSIELFKAGKAAFVIKLPPASDRVVIEIENLGHPLAAQAVIQKQDGVRTAGKPMLGQAVAHQRNQLPQFSSAQKPAANHAAY